ncbi:hypothetical protein SNK04_003907 [Fusarium graminearum]
MSPFTVGDYLAERIAQIDIRHHFIVPGDYNLILLDKLGGHPSLTEIGCTNELNCSLAAEGYARGHGVSVCIVTYSVGAFSAFNGIGSAYAENLPVILISGSPNTNDVSQHILHHTLGIYDTTYQLEMAKRSLAVLCAFVKLLMLLSSLTVLFGLLSPNGSQSTLRYRPTWLAKRVPVLGPSVL